MHDFEAANSDELELKRGEVVLVIPTASIEDQVSGEIFICITSNVTCLKIKEAYNVNKICTSNPCCDVCGIRKLGGSLGSKKVSGSCLELLRKKDFFQKTSHSVWRRKHHEKTCV